MAEVGEGAKNRVGPKVVDEVVSSIEEIKRVRGEVERPMTEFKNVLRTIGQPMLTKYGDDNARFGLMRVVRDFLTQDVGRKTPETIIAEAKVRARGLTGPYVARLERDTFFTGDKKKTVAEVRFMPREVQAIVDSGEGALLSIYRALEGGNWTGEKTKVTKMLMEGVCEDVFVVERRDRK